MEKPLWRFTDNQGSFISRNAGRLASLYFPLCNSAPIMASVTPDLHGDLKTDYNSFLLEPVSRIGLSNLRSSRNFWIYIAPERIWSATGVSKDIRTIQQDEFWLEAGLLWHRITRQNKAIGLKAAITSFIPAGEDPVEIMRVDITNITGRSIRFTPTAAIPIYGRSANNLHDHRHVTSLFNRVRLTKHGVVMTPTLVFDEKGHRPCLTSYFVFGVDGKGRPPQYLYSTQGDFAGTCGDLEAPWAVFENRLPQKGAPSNGKEAMGALRFASLSLPAGKTRSYLIVMGIADRGVNSERLFVKFNTLPKVRHAFEQTTAFWQAKSEAIATHTADAAFDNWVRWVSIQPVLRKIFGCSFLPDFDYGKGGRGWRDLWQDCLAMILNKPEEARTLLVNNFAGVRIDGSNATIIGQKPGEFIADRNNISRVWMDHGVWPLVSTALYIHQTGDVNIVLEKAAYFRDHQLCRGRAVDTGWDATLGLALKTKTGHTYTGTILEHILIQNLVQFFNVGEHNHIRLENADWNDGLDMAADFGESVAFTAMYAGNLKTICAILEKLKTDKIMVCTELIRLLDTLGVTPVDYNNARQKIRHLDKYFNSVNAGISGAVSAVAVAKVIDDLRKKADWISQHIQRKEWLKTGFFNGYYNNDKQRLEGRRNGRTHMTLTGQVFPVISGIATSQQIRTLFKNAKRHLQDTRLAGFRLNTDFKTQQLNLGRAFSFNYGDKENGAFFNHMAIMFAYGLYAQGFAREGWEVIRAIYHMAKNSETSVIYPCLPEYFNSQGRGMYSYLTGSASWFMLTLVTQVFGIRGSFGDLVVEPRLSGEQFSSSNTITIQCTFAGRRLAVTYINERTKDFGQYHISRVRINATTACNHTHLRAWHIKRRDFLTLANQPCNTIELTLS